MTWAVWGNGNRAGLFHNSVLNPGALQECQNPPHSSPTTQHLLPQQWLPHAGLTWVRPRQSLGFRLSDFSTPLVGFLVRVKLQKQDCVDSKWDDAPNCTQKHPRYNLRLTLNREDLKARMIKETRFSGSTWGHGGHGEDSGWRKDQQARQVENVKNQSGCFRNGTLEMRRHTQVNLVRSRTLWL